MIKILLLLYFTPLLIYGQNNNFHLGIDLFSTTNIGIFKKDKTFTDTLEVIAVLHHLNDSKPYNNVTTLKCFMERKGILQEYNQATGGLGYSKGFMKIVEQTELFYYENMLLQIGHLITDYFNLDGTSKRMKVIISKNKVLQIHPINNNNE